MCLRDAASQRQHRSWKRRQRQLCALFALVLCARFAASLADTPPAPPTAQADDSGQGSSVANTGASGSAADPGPTLVVIKLRPSKTRTKADVVAKAQEWKPTDWGASGSSSVSVVDNNAAVLTTSSLQDALKAKDWLLQQRIVYEVELNQGEEREFRRPGDVSLEELRRGLSREAQHERRERDWAWLRRTARQQGVKIKRPRRRRLPFGGAGKQRPGQRRLEGDKDEL